MGVNYFTFNGSASSDFGLYVGGQGTYNAPQRDVSKISIPGRNGDLIKDNGRWLNVAVPYNIIVMNEFAYTADAVRAWLCSNTDYARLEDTYNPDYFRLARFSSSIEFVTSAFNRTGKATITFDCKPQRFLKTGEIPVNFSGNGVIYNPTRYASRPLIRVLGTGSGTLTIGDYQIGIEDMATYIDIDSEIQDCYIGETSANNKVTMPNGFPLLPPGETPVGFSGDITGIEITGRWYTL